MPPSEGSPAVNLLDYDSAALMAVARNRSLVEARTARGLVNAAIIQARILPNPILSGSVDIPTDGATAGTSTGYTAGVAWQINPLFALRAASAAEREEARAVELGIAWNEWQVAENARLGVVRLVMLARRAQLAQSVADEWDAQLQLLERAQSSQDVSTLDVQAARSAATDARLATLQLAQERRLARLDWLETLGLDPSSDADVAPEPHLPESGSPPPLGELLRRLPETRLDLVGLSRGVEAQSGRVRAATLRALPGIELSVGRTVDNANLGILNVGVSIGLPFFDRNQGAIHLARASREQLRAAYATRLQTARFDVGRALAEIASVRERLAVAEASITPLTRLLEQTEQLRSQGDLSVLNLYELRRTWLGRQLLVEELRQRELELRVLLQLAAGAPWEMESGT